jgi:thiol-disulfide isomerase/thioredoxin
MTATRTAAAAVLLVLLATAAGCRGGGAAADRPAGPPSPLADCAGLTAPPPAGQASAGPGRPPPTPPVPPDPAARPLPALALPCFTGGEPFPLAELRGPAVVNLWASWCGPCRKELPALQRFADQAAGRVHVLGVVTGDRPPAAAALATDLGIRFPALTDPDRRLQAELGAFGLPVTVFVDAAGRVRHVHAGALDRPALAALVREQLGAGP